MKGKGDEIKVHNEKGSNMDSLKIFEGCYE